VLKLMRKGTNALRNVQLLKWCKEFGVAVDWNLLYGFPGETRDDYSAIRDMLPAISFLSPPVACGPIRMDRFSPYFESSDEFGFVNVRPIQPYSYLYPFEMESLMKIAYYFDFDYKPEVDPTDYAREVIQYVEAWRRRPDQGLLCSVKQSDGTLLLQDTRAIATQREVVFSGLEQAVYEYCDEFRCSSSVIRHLTEAFPQIAISSRGVQAFLDSLVANCLMVTDGRNYLSLAVQKRETPAGDVFVETPPHNQPHYKQEPAGCN